jgi:hypothetical protein
MTRLRYTIALLVAAFIWSPADARGQDADTYYKGKIDLRILTPRAGQAVGRNQLISVVEVRQDVTLAELVVEIRPTGPKQEWRQIGRSESEIDLLHVVDFAWSTDELLPGRYILRARATGANGETGHVEVAVLKTPPPPLEVPSVQTFDFSLIERELFIILPKRLGGQIIRADLVGQVRMLFEEGESPQSARVSIQDFDFSVPSIGLEIDLTGDGEPEQVQTGEIRITKADLPGRPAFGKIDLQTGEFTLPWSVRISMPLLERLGEAPIELFVPGTGLYDFDTGTVWDTGVGKILRGFFAGAVFASVNGGIRIPEAPPAPPPASCACEQIDVVATGSVPAGSTLAFPNSRALRQAPALPIVNRDVKKLGPNVDDAAWRDQAENLIIRNFRLNFMVDATLKSGSDRTLCSQEQQVKATVSLRGQTRSPRKDGVNYPFDGPDYVRDGAGYTTPISDPAKGIVLKEHTTTDPIHFRWIDAPGSGNSDNDRAPGGIDWKSAFYVYVKGSGPDSSCYCDFVYEAAMAANGTIATPPGIKPGSKTCVGMTNLPR